MGVGVDVSFMLREEGSIGLFSLMTSSLNICVYNIYKQICLEEITFLAILLNPLIFAVDQLSLFC